MARSPRLQFEGAFYHLFNRGAGKQPIFFDERDFKTFLQLLAEATSEFQLRLFAYCLMTNHFHLFLQTLKANLSQSMQSLQSRYAHYINQRYKRPGALFQGRFKSPLVDEESYGLSLVRYIHRNPIKARLVQKPEDYAWSSYPCYVGKFPTWEWLNTEWLMLQFDKDPVVAKQLFIQTHNEEPPQTETHIIEKMGAFLGIPKGVRPHGV